MTHTSRFSSRFLSLAVACVAALSLVATAADAKRLGGGSGSKIGKPANTQAVQKQATPAPAAAPTAAAGAPAAAAAAKPANKWLGPLAGLAAGLGIAALLSHFGLGGALASFLSTALIVVGVLLLAMFIYRRFIAKPNPQLATAQANPASNYDAPAAQQHAQQYQASNTTSGGAAVTTPTMAHPAIPDPTAFANNAKQQYTALQAAWDAGDMTKLRNMTSDSLFMELAQQIANRKGAPNQTEIMNLHCEYLGAHDDGDETVVTLRFSGTAREDGAPTAGFEDIWTLVKPRSAAGGWLLAGVESN